jgi:RNA polymerase sigma factor (TIGR02999 family)
MDAREREPVGHDITALLLAWREEGGRGAAAERLTELVYDELKRIAHAQLAREASGHTLCTTALVHEVYLRLVDETRVRWTSRAHFFAVAARTARRVLIEHARRFRAAKRGGGHPILSLDEATMPVEERAELLIALDEALGRLEALDERLGRVVECRFFGGLTEEETAATLGITARTVRRDWIKAKAWLYRELRADADGEEVRDRA